VIFTGLLMIEVINFEVMNEKIVIPEEWNENIEAGCGAEALDDAYQKKSMEQ
jgi:hypothetical protein